MLFLLFFLFVFLFFRHRELISAEEGKLAVSRSLLDLKLEHSKLLEKFESDRYALTTDLLAAKNEVVELEMR